MAAVRNRNSTAELAVRRRLWANGLRYRLNVKLPGKPDLVFPARRVAVFIDGDLWHGNSWRIRGLPSIEAQFPTRTEWWVAKITRNMQRDREVNEQLILAGWAVLRYWESDALADPNAVARAIATHVRGAEPTEFRVFEMTRIERRRLGSVRTRGPSRTRSPS
ncbi:MAG: very short patch repair endonuclease [Chloroflexia bacterium]|nr:very short patch repair endonuclease [Chloroflexia bacterium]